MSAPRRRKPCPAARLIEAELEADKAQHRYDRTRSDAARIALKGCTIAGAARRAERPLMLRRRCGVGK